MNFTTASVYRSSANNSHTGVLLGLASEGLTRYPNPFLPFQFLSRTCPRPPLLPDVCHTSPQSALIRLLHSGHSFKEVLPGSPPPPNPPALARLSPTQLLDGHSGELVSAKELIMAATALGAIRRSFFAGFVRVPVLGRGVTLLSPLLRAISSV